MDYSSILMSRYLRPIETLSESWLLKSVVAVLATLWSMLTDMFATSAELVLLLLIALMVDFVTGIIASKRAKYKITSLGFRQSIIKTVEYLVILLLLAGIGNTFQQDIPYVEYLVKWGYFFAIITEVKSIAENITKGKESKVADVVDYVMNKLNDKENNG